MLRTTHSVPGLSLATHPHGRQDPRLRSQQVGPLHHDAQPRAPSTQRIAASHLSLLRFLHPSIFERAHSVEDRVAGAAFLPIHAEAGEALELITRLRRGVGRAQFEFRGEEICN